MDVLFFFLFGLMQDAIKKHSKHDSFSLKIMKFFDYLYLHDFHREILQNHNYIYQLWSTRIQGLSNENCLKVQEKCIPMFIFSSHDSLFCIFSLTIISHINATYMTFSRDVLIQHFIPHKKNLIDRFLFDMILLIMKNTNSNRVF